mgnify:CR=1 FL=1
MSPHPIPAPRLSFWEVTKSMPFPTAANPPSQEQEKKTPPDKKEEEEKQQQQITGRNTSMKHDVT